MSDLDLPGVRPLTARSAVLSTLLGEHPPRLPVRSLVRAGELFDIAEGTIRVALSRMVAAGDLVHDDGHYVLTDRLRARQARQDESRSPTMSVWDGTWEVAVVTADRRTAAERSAFRQAMAGLRLAELREGTWLRPANLARQRPAIVAEYCTFLTARPDDDPVALAGALWDLEEWMAHAHRLRAAMDRTQGLRDGFMLSAAVLRHLLADPLLPAELLPADWPGARLRDHFEKFDAAFQSVLRAHLGVA